MVQDCQENVSIINFKFKLRRELLAWEKSDPFGIRSYIDMNVQC